LESRGAAAPPPCPFERGGDDKVNFPDVRNVLPFRGARRRKGAGGGGAGGGGGGGGDLNDDDNIHYGDENNVLGNGLALEALDVEEQRARELANCTIDVLANTFPVDMDSDIERLDRQDGGIYDKHMRNDRYPSGSGDDACCASSSVSSEDELSAARRLAEVADELRCQRYFDDKTANGGGDPVGLYNLNPVDP
jgi:hypothetical protein